MTNNYEYLIKINNNIIFNDLHIIYLEPNDEMPSETMYSCGKQRDDNPTHLSQVSQVSKSYNILWLNETSSKI